MINSYCKEENEMTGKCILSDNWFNLKQVGVRDQCIDRTQVHVPLKAKREV